MYLKISYAEYHTLQACDSRTFHIAVHNLHPTTSTTEICAAIECLGYNVRQVSSVLVQIYQTPIPDIFRRPWTLINNEIF